MNVLTIYFNPNLAMGCYKEYTATNGTVQSPSYPQRYPRNVICSYFIKNPIPRYRIRIKFNNFELQGGSSCQYDYVEVYDGESTQSRILGTYCGTSTPPTLIATGNRVLVVFKSDGAYQKKGFQFFYTAGNYPLPCKNLMHSKLM